MDDFPAVEEGLGSRIEKSHWYIMEVITKQRKVKQE
jgi:hypothetical protein